MPLRVWSQVKLVSHPRGATAILSRSSLLFAAAGGLVVCAHATATARLSSSPHHRPRRTDCFMGSSSVWYAQRQPGWERPLRDAPADEAVPYSPRVGCAHAHAMIGTRLRCPEHAPSCGPVSWAPRDNAVATNGIWVSY